MAEAPSQKPLTIRMNERDNVAIVANDGGLKAGTQFPSGLTLREHVPQGHKVALVDLAEGTPVLRYNVTIGYALKDIRAGSLRAKYDVIIVPGELSEMQIIEGHRAGAVPPEFAGGIGEAGVQNFRDFVNEGGTLVTMDKATEFAAKQFALPVKNALEGAKPQDFYVPGSLLKIVLDTENPIAYGMPRETAAFVEQNAAFDVTGNAKAVGNYPLTNPLMSGWILGESNENIRDRAAAAYDKYQKCGFKAARNLMATGW